MKVIETEQLLSEDFLVDLYYTCLFNEYVLAMVSEHVRKKYLPDKDFQQLHLTFCDLFKEHKRTPTIGLLKQSVSRGKKGVLDLIEQIEEQGSELSTDEALLQIEKFIRQVKCQEALQKALDCFEKGAVEQTQAILAKFNEWQNSFGLLDEEFVDVVANFRSNHIRNRQKRNAANKLAPVTRFYIDELDERNAGRNLRGQLTCVLASSGVGKSHFARWIGKCACMDGLGVLHIQLEGKESEVVDAYSASFAQCSTFLYENGLITDKKIDEIVKQLEAIKGTLKVKAFQRFNQNVTTTRVHNEIQSYKKRYGKAPDIVIIDSMDLLDDASGHNYSEKGERLKRIKVCRDLKDIADDENIWVVATYQSTIEDREKLNDENFVLSEYNCSEAKGLVRPLTHLLTLNQSDREYHENTMRINVAKSRFFKRGKPIKIATNYDEEQFYDRKRSINFIKIKKTA